MLNFNNFGSYFSPNRNSSWIPIAKVGGFLILLGLLILILKEVIIAILAAVSIGVGVFILSVAFRVWRVSKYM